MAKRQDMPRLPKGAEELIWDLFRDFASNPNLVGLRQILCEGSPIENLARLRDSHARALFRRIQNQSTVFTEADREELMDLAGKAATGGLVIDGMQHGLRRGEENNKRGKRAREERTEKAQTWHAEADRLAAQTWAGNRKLKPSRIGQLIHPKLQEVCPEAPKAVGTVQKYLSGKKVSTSS